MLAAVNQNGNALELVPAHFKNDTEVVTKAVMNAGMALEFASK